MDQDRFAAPIADWTGELLPPILHPILHLPAMPTGVHITSYRLCRPSQCQFSRLHTLAWPPLIRPSEKPRRQRAWSHGHMILTSANVMLQTAMLLETVFLVHVAWHAYQDKTSKRFADAQILRLLSVKHHHCPLNNSVPSSHHDRPIMSVSAAARSCNTIQCQPLSAFTIRQTCRHRCLAAAGAAHRELG